MASPVCTAAQSRAQLIQLQEVTSTGKVIGKGAYGRVIEVYVHGTLCAAKEVHPILVEGVNPTECEATKQSFLTECVNSSRIHHPNIVQVLGIHYPTPEAKLPWLVMEMMECSVKRFVEKYERDEVSVHIKLSILVDISQGLEFLHGQDIVHRDLSSNNVLLTVHFTAKIADLGVAKVIEHNTMKTQTQAPGTSDFMPPEALLRKPKYGKPVDVFSLGCIACHVMSHQWPEPKDLFPEGLLTARTEVERREKYFHSFTELRLKTLIEQCLHNLPEERPQIPAVCSQLKNLKTEEIPNTTANSVFNAVQNERRIVELTIQMETALQAKDKELQGMNREMQAKDNWIKKLQQQNKKMQKYIELQQKDDVMLKSLREVQEMDKEMHEGSQELYDKIKKLQEKTYGKMQEKIKEMLANITEKQEQKSNHVNESLMLLHEHNQKTNSASDTLTESKDYNIGSSTTKSRDTNDTDLPSHKESSFQHVDLQPADNEDDNTGVNPKTHNSLLAGGGPTAGIKVHSQSARATTTRQDNLKDPPTQVAVSRYKYWQCAVCEVVNEDKKRECKKCLMIRGGFSASVANCKLCDLIVYIADEKTNSFAAACPMCKNPGLVIYFVE